jgi:hypothetical protein
MPLRRGSYDSLSYFKCIDPCNIIGSLVLASSNVSAPPDFIAISTAVGYYQVLIYYFFIVVNNADPRIIAPQ